MDVGVRELKAHLSDFLDRAAEGEIIRVTERGVPKALLGPVPGAGRVEQGIAEGWIRPASGQRQVPPRRFRAKRRIEDVIAEEREDRRWT
jgi:prevent-host-death family protein